MQENGHLPLFDIYHEDGSKLGSMALSEKSQGILDEGEWVTILYHTPRMLRDRLGNKSGGFALHRVDDRIVTDNPAHVAEFLALQSAIAEAGPPTAAQVAKTAG